MMRLVAFLCVLLFLYGLWSVLEGRRWPASQELPMAIQQEMLTGRGARCVADLTQTGLELRAAYQACATVLLETTAAPSAAIGAATLPQ